MLNIGKLRPTSAAYYLDSVADSQAAYYVGDGEAPGRWIGSLAPELGLAGAVDPEAFTRLLAGLHPRTGEELVSAAGSNARARSRSAQHVPPSPAGATADIAQAAAELGVSTRSVRHWVATGRALLDQAAAHAPAGELGDPGEATARVAELIASGVLGAPGHYLLGFPAEGSGRGRPSVLIPRAEIDRLQAERTPPAAQAGWDLVFRPPKSYSVLWAIAGGDVSTTIKAIHDEAVSTALGYLEDSAALARKSVQAGQGRRTVRAEAGGFVVAGFDHRDSRAGDPLLHTHCVVANVTKRADGKWVTLDSRGIYAHGLAADAIYQATFRHLAERRLGIASEPVVRGWADAAGVPRPVIEHFSKRSEEIAAELADAGATSPAARQAAALASRRAKDPDRDHTGLHERWRQEAAGLGFDDDAVARVLDRAEPRSPEPASVGRLFDRLAGPHGLTELAATFTRADVVCALATALGGDVHGRDVSRLADQFLGSPRVTALAENRPGQRRARVLDASGEFRTHLPDAAFTTPELAAIESDLIRFATEEAGTGPRASAAAIADTLASRPELSDEQIEMVHAVCDSPGRVRCVVGYPGAGKTFAAEACVAAFAASGVPVQGCAVTAEAADELGRSTGLTGHGLGCDTIARLLLDLDHAEAGGLPVGTVVLVDEASTVGHRDLARLAAHTAAAGGALVLIGDPHQHGPVGPGHFFGWLVANAPERVVSLTANHRQVDRIDPTGAPVSLAQERLANHEYREGKIAESLARRDADGKVVRTATVGELYDTIASDWYVEWLSGARDPMVAPRNTVRDQLNRRARSLLERDGHLHGPAVTVGATELRAGDRIVTRQNNRWLRSPADPSWFVKNGSRGQVVSVDTDACALVVDFDGDGGPHRVRLPGSYVTAGHVEWGYAVTDYGVQGRTLTRSLAVVDDTSTRAGTYVATTRGRLENRVYIVDGTTADPADPDLTHGRPDAVETSLDHLADRLATRRPGALLHDMDPWVADAGHLARSHTLCELRAALTHVDLVLAAAPPDVTRRIAGAQARLEELTARRRPLLDQLRASQGRGSVAAVDRVTRDIGSLDAGRRRLAGLIDELEGSQRERTAFLAQHRPELDRQALLREAVAARETQVRLAAPDHVPPRLLELVPEPPPGAPHGDRHQWRRAIEQVALFRDGAGPPGGDVPDATTLADLVGGPPQSPEQQHELDQVMASLAELGAGEPAVHVPDHALPGSRGAPWPTDLPRSQPTVRSATTRATERATNHSHSRPSQLPPSSARATSAPSTATQRRRSTGPRPATSSPRVKRAGRRSRHTTPACPTP